MVTLPGLIQRISPSWEVLTEQLGVGFELCSEEFVEDKKRFSINVYFLES